MDLLNNSPAKKFIYSKKGLTFVLSLILGSVLTVLIFLNFLPFGKDIFNQLFPKPPSKAAGDQAGTLDPTWSDDGVTIWGSGPNLDINNSITYDSVHGKLYVVGEQNALLDNGVKRQGDVVVLRYNLDGTLDTTWGLGGVVSYGVPEKYEDGRSIVYDTTREKVYVFGQIADLQSAPADPLVLRYNLDGTLDPTWSDDGVARWDDPGEANTADTAFDSINNQLYVAINYILGTEGVYNNTILRYNSDGNLDPTWSGDGIAHYLANSGEMIHSLQWDQVNNKLYAAGHLVNLDNPTDSHWDFSILRLNTDGSLDTTWSEDGVQTWNSGLAFAGLSGGQTDVAYAVEIDSATGKVYVAGACLPRNVPNYPNANNTPVLRYNMDGTLDPTWSKDGVLVYDTSTSEGTNTINDLGYDLKIDSTNQRIYVTGTASNPSSINTIATTRFDDAGNLDPLWGNGGLAVWDSGVTSFSWRAGANPGLIENLALDGLEKLYLGGYKCDGTDCEVVTLRYFTQSSSVPSPAPTPQPIILQYNPDPPSNYCVP